MDLHIRPYERPRNYGLYEKDKKGIFVSNSKNSMDTNDIRKDIESYIQRKYSISPEHPWHQYPDYATFKELYSQKWFAIIMSVSGRKLGLPTDEEIPIINVKADTEIIMMMGRTPGFMPGYHMNKRNWLTILLDGTVPFEQVTARIDDSYKLIADTPTRRIYEAVKKIPKGKVATYGQIAEMAGDRKMARAVVNALHKNPEHDSIPCHRVVNSKGELAEAFVFGGVNMQEKYLHEEGVTVINGKVDLKQFGL